MRWGYCYAKKVKRLEQFTVMVLVRTEGWPVPASLPAGELVLAPARWPRKNSRKASNQGGRAMMPASRSVNGAGVTASRTIRRAVAVGFSPASSAIASSHSYSCWDKLRVQLFSGHNC